MGKKKLTFEDFGKFVSISEDEQKTLVGGTRYDGADFYEIRYGTSLPNGTAYDPISDTCYSIDGVSVSNKTSYKVVEKCVMCDDAAKHMSGGPVGAAIIKFTHFMHEKYSMVRDTIYD